MSFLQCFQDVWLLKRVTLAFCYVFQDVLRQKGQKPESQASVGSPTESSNSDENGKAGRPELYHLGTSNQALLMGQGTYLVAFLGMRNPSHWPKVVYLKG